MNIPLVFVAVAACLTALYMMNRFIRRPSVITGAILGIQLFSATVIVFALVQNVLTIPVVEIAAIAAGIILPAFVVAIDHIVFYRKIRKMGVTVPFIEKKEKRGQDPDSSSFLKNAELWKREIHAMDVYRSLSIQDPHILENIKKKLIITQRLINLEKYETAVEQYRFLCEIIPDSHLICYNTGFLHCFIGRYREAYKYLRRAYELVKQEKQWGKDFEEVEKGHKHYLPDDLDIVIEFNIGYSLYNLGKYEHSIRRFKKVLEKKPDLTVAYKNIARAYLKIGMDDKAIEYLEKGRMDVRDSVMRVVLGSIYYKKGDTKKALEILDEAVKANEKQIEALKWRGKAAIKEKIYDKAVECFNTLIEMEPAETSHYYHLALAQRSMGNNEDALRTYEAGIAQNQTDSTLLYYYGTLLDEVGKKEKAVEVLYKSIQSDELLEDAFNYLGVLLGQMKRYRESVQVFEKGIRAFNKSYQLHFNLGIVLEMSRRLEDAIVYFEKAYDLNRNDPMLYYHYTAALLKKRDYAKAIRICKAGMSNYPDDAELIYGLSKVYTHMGEKDIAIDLLKKVLELDPTFAARIKEEPDFKTLYRHPGYRSLIAS
ncbi:MAG: tetratricopeptide repeat protein [Clostridiaceae bacterium]|nr:tetratricopeptide repeat protein [Clostridiaceae bacterium]